MLTIPDRIVLFDYGEVISRSPSVAARTALAELVGVPLEELDVAYERHRLDLDRGTLGVVDYWRTMAAELGQEWSLSQVQRLWTVDFTSWFEPEPAVVDLLVELHEGGTRMALLSNAGLDFGDPLRRTPFATLMERVFISAEMGLVKPDPEIYRRALADLGVEPAQAVFVDNKLVNVEAAAALGITTHHFTGVDGLRAFLRSLALGSP
ncbi:HAD family phosphatase [Nocardioides sp.]|uniref:HAD family hydrolase n=1 Tax=Nocardioides sp. TaxID=35761 RepID=UPI002723D1D2|nr:HAD family phosphatase [Nocardioides sp.]MDO9457377.1 HAD family phosphatase [Nocardioides sp.]